MTNPPAAPGANPSDPIDRSCRFCGAPLEHVVIDLGMSPLCESFLAADELERMEPFYPLRVRICGVCLLVQLPAYVSPDAIFTEYAYFSSFSDSWVEHARRYTAAMVERLDLGERGFVVELGSNDGYLLQHFVHRGIRVLGIDPALNVAVSAEERGVRTRTAFFGAAVAREVRADEGAADLVIGNNVLAQVPDLNDFVAGVVDLLAPSGLVSIEVPHLMRLISGNQFDTIYHEHFSYFSLATVRRIFEAHGLAVVDVEELPSHGGSLRIFGRHAGAGAEASDRVEAVLRDEAAAGLGEVATYQAFGTRVEAIKRDLLGFLIDARRDGRTVVGYGAPGKANTLLNYCGIRTDLVQYTVDRNTYKQGRFTPGTHLPIHHPDRIAETRPDHVWILPWNLGREIRAQLSYIGDWGGRFLTAIPDVRMAEAGQ
ncbi:MAG: class I SAM-dependent methyltransferase [Chloroflexi bacterium]|nr:class I SAM-dependent methyltransferase [Chloroflexota bacterium]